MNLKNEKDEWLIAALKKIILCSQLDDSFGN